MKRKEFDEITKSLKKGDLIRVIYRGISYDYEEKGRFQKIDDRGFLYLDRGFAHSYRKILAIDTVKEAGEG